jgi:putative FmdB family regulatory protein
MPTYDYECKACGKTIEIFHSMSEPARKKCPACGKQKLERLMGAGAGFIFKGSGFYITDYRSDDYKAKAKADSEGSAPKSSSDSASSGSSDGKSSGSSEGKSSSGSDGKKSGAEPKKSAPETKSSPGTAKEAKT